MMRSLIQLSFLIFLTYSSTSQVVVNATVGVSTFSYPTLKASFDAINLGTHQGVIHVLIGNAPNQVITETLQPVLNRSGVGAANYSMIYLNPAFENITITCSLAGACCTPTGIINLNAASNIILDGRINSIGSNNDLTIENSNNTSTWSAAIILNGASNNLIRNCNVKSSAIGTSPGVATISLLYNSTNASSCKNNLIEYCNITKSGNNIPNTAIASNSTNSSLKNSNNIIQYSNISDFKRYGIWLGNNGIVTHDSAWLIQNNLFFQSTTITLDATNYCNYAICVGYHDIAGTVFYSGTGTHQILNNTISGNGNNGNWTINSNASNSGLVAGGIFFSAGSDGYSEISGNEISNYSVSTFVSDQSSLSLAGFNGIYTINTKVKIGAAKGNKIHDITLEHKYSSWSGIVTGIYMKNNFDRSCEIKNNKIYNISAETGAGAFQYFYGIKNGGSSSGYTDQISNNNITKINLKLNSNCYGIYGYGAITQNHISKIKLQNGLADLNGIFFAGVLSTNIANYRVDNNEVILGTDDLGNVTATTSSIYGINLNNSAHAFYNSILLSGNHTGTGSAVCMRINNSTMISLNIANNLFYNARSGGTAQQYNIICTGSNAIVCSNNAYIFDQGINNLGLWNNSTICPALINWTASSGEQNSISDTKTNKPISTFFRNAFLQEGNNLMPSIEGWLCKGKLVSQQFDIMNNQRNTSAPTTIGAYELQCELFNTTGTIYVFTGNGNWDVTSNWQYNVAPPSNLNVGDKIIIDPVVNGECLLNVPQVIGAGSSIIIFEGKTLRIPENLQIQ